MRYILCDAIASDSSPLVTQPHLKESSSFKTATVRVGVGGMVEWEWEGLLVSKLDTKIDCLFTTIFSPWQLLEKQEKLFLKLSQNWIIRIKIFLGLSLKIEFSKKNAIKCNKKTIIEMTYLMLQAVRVRLEKRITNGFLFKSFLVIMTRRCVPRRTSQFRLMSPLDWLSRKSSMW